MFDFTPGNQQKVFRWHHIWTIRFKWNTKVTKETVEVLQHLFLCQEGAYKSFPDNNCITLMIFSHLVRAFRSPVGKTIFKTWQGPDNTEEKTTLGCLSSIHLVSLSYMQAHTQTRKNTRTRRHTHTTYLSQFEQPTHHVSPFLENVCNNFFHLPKLICWSIICPQTRNGE